MNKESQSVDDFLGQQSVSEISATIEPIEGKPDFVKVTPWTPESGCLCHLSLTIRKSALEAVTPTGQSHICCGKTLKVAQLRFKKGEKLPLEDVFSQLHSAAHQLHAGHPNQRGVPSPNFGVHYPFGRLSFCETERLNCLGYARTTREECTCNQRYEICSGHLVIPEC